ncbi:MAG: hypothetical protein LBM62_02305 [Mediterranea sp.]|jgi:hypothetical protein|nr:hypothetical protein [Mediterranea sp.]
MTTLLLVLSLFLTVDQSASPIKVDTGRRDTLKLSEITAHVKTISLNQAPDMPLVAHTDKYLFFNGYDVIKQYGTEGKFIRTIFDKGVIYNICVDEAGQRLFVFIRENDANYLSVYDFFGQQKGKYKIAYPPIACSFFKGKLYILSCEMTAQSKGSKYRLSTFDMNTQKEHFLSFETFEQFASTDKNVLIAAPGCFFVHKDILHFNIAGKKSIYQIVNNKVSTALTWELSGIKQGLKEDLCIYNSYYADNYLIIRYLLRATTQSGDHTIYTYIVTPDGEHYNLHPQPTGGVLYDDLKSRRYIELRNSGGKENLSYYLNGKTLYIVKLK